MKRPDICIAIPTYQREKVLVDTILDVLKQSHKNLELVVVDQSTGHDAETEQALSAISDPRFRYFKTTPPSITAARNFALKVSRAPLVLFLDDDVTLHKDMVKFHLKAHQSHPGVSAVAGRVLQKGFPIKKEVLRFDEFAISKGVFTATEAGYTNTFPGGNHSIVVKDALSLGGFDTRYYYNAFREESDMGMRMVKAGMRIYYEPMAALTHLAAPSGGTRAKQQYRHLYDTSHFYRNEIFFTIRAVELRKLPKALRLKYNMYCPVPSRKQGLKRRFYFMLGIVGALWRLAFGRQVESKEVS